MALGRSIRLMRPTRLSSATPLNKGAIYSSPQTVFFVNTSTIVGNTATNAGAGIYTPGGLLNRAINSILAGNFLTAGAESNIEAPVLLSPDFSVYISMAMAPVAA